MHRSDFLRYSKGKVIPLQALTGPERSRRLSSQILKQSANEGDKVVIPTTGRLYPQEIFLVFISVSG
jgi:hypothetical protein